MTSLWQPFQEPIRQTLFRTVMIAFVVGGAIALPSRKWSTWPLATLLVLWPSFGGHWVEVWFLNWLRPRVSPHSRCADCHSRSSVIRRWLSSFARDASDGVGLCSAAIAAVANLVARGRSIRWR